MAKKEENLEDGYNVNLRELYEMKHGGQSTWNLYRRMQEENKSFGHSQRFTELLFGILYSLHSRVSQLEEELKKADEPSPPRVNRFARCETIQEVVGQAVGAGSMAWVGGTGSAEFDSEEAIKIADEAEERIQEILAVDLNRMGFISGHGSFGLGR